MVLEIIALTFDFVGKVLIAVMALLVHRRVRKEHKIDKKVLRGMRLEQSVGFLAILLLSVAYVIKLNN